MILGQTSDNNNPCYPNISQGLDTSSDDTFVSSSVVEASSTMDINIHSNSLLYSLSLLKEKVNQVQSLVSIIISPDQTSQQPESTSLAITRMSTTIQEIIVAASSMVFTCQQMGTSNPSTNQLHRPAVANANGVQENELLQSNFGGSDSGKSYFSTKIFDWYDENYNSYNSNRGTLVIRNNNKMQNKRENVENTVGEKSSSVIKNYDIIELDATDLLAKYSHYCQVCGKGFKRDANLRMHMRAHGDEYKTHAALSNPMKNNKNEGDIYPIDSNDKESCLKLPRKYSCPQEGCRWNQKHVKFQPLKSMVCVKNHYKRSHCPKMYVCKRCNKKQFSVLSDLRTHEKHCGDVKWQCSCGTTFSRKDKLMGHVALFIGHSPAIAATSSSSTKQAAIEMEFKCN